MFGRPSFPWCMPLFAAATAALGAEARTPETTNAPSSYAAAVSAVMLHDETLRPDLFPPLNVVVGQPLGGLESSVFIEGQKQRQRSQLLAVSAGLVAVVCLAVAFFVLQCARKALFPRLFGPLGRRALSDSEWEDKWLEECPEYDSEGQEDEGDEEGTWDEIPAAERGESVALQTLEALRDLMTLGMRTMPHLTFPDRGTLLVLLLTISTQELVLCGVYATPEVEAERQKTVDFIRENGLKELQQLHTTREKCNAKGRAKKMLRLLERFGTSRSEPKLSELAVEASICAYRISQCYKALEQLQPWVERDLPIPEKVVEQALAVFSYTRKTAKSRLKLDPAANAWVVDIQEQVRYQGLLDPGYKMRSSKYRMPFKEEMQKLTERYAKTTKGLCRSIEEALSNQPLEQRMQEERHEVELQQQQGLKQLRQQQHPFAGEVPETIAGPSSIIRPVGQPATPGASVAIMASRPSQPPPAPCEGTAPAGATSSLRAPLLRNVQPPHSDLQQRIRTAHPGHAGQPSHLSAPSWGNVQQETKDEQQASLGPVAVKSGLRADAPPFIPRGSTHTGAQKHTPRTESGTGEGWQLVPPPPGFASPWRPVHPSATGQSGSPLAHPPRMPTQSEIEHVETMAPIDWSPPDSSAPLLHLRAPPKPMGEPSVADPSQPTEGPSLRFPRRTVQRPTSHIPGRALPPPQQIPGGWRHTRSLESGSPAPLWQPLERGTQGAPSRDFSLSEEDLNPVLRLIQDAFPSGDAGWRGAAVPREQGGEGWLRFPPPHPPSSSGDSSAVDDNGRAMPTENQGSSASSGVSPQTQGGAAWSPWREDPGDSGEQ